MAGSRRNRRRRRRRRPCPVTPVAAPPPSQASTSPPSSACRDTALMQSGTKKRHTASTSALATMLGHRVWADLPEGLLHSILRFLTFPRSFRDLLAFSATCRSWRDAFSSLSTSAFSFIPPLLLRPSQSTVCFTDCYGLRHHPCLYKLYKCTWQLLIPTNPPAYLRCLVPPETMNSMRFLGCSHGHLIFSRHGCCHIVDVLTGCEVTPPRVPITDNQDLCYGILTAPLSSPNANLLLSNRYSLFQWQVGSDMWSEHPLGGVDLHIVIFKGQIFAMDFQDRFFIIDVAPNLGVRELAVVWEEDMTKCWYLQSWLVVRGDELLLVRSETNVQTMSVFIRAFRLDSSTELLKWEKVENLGNWALFLGPDWRTPTFSCQNPERWGGRRNCIYYASMNESWSTIRLGELVANINYQECPLWHPHERGRFTWPLPIWVFPSMLS